MLRRVSVGCIVATLLAASSLATRASAWEPLGYPYSTWGEISRSEIEGLKLDGYGEQGIDVLRIPNSRLILNFFSGLRFTESDRHEDVWNNKIAPTIGTKLKVPIALPAGHWGQLDIGIRGERVFHHASHAHDTLEMIVFARWGFGGDWKKK
ncbi:MAG: hypothetical protein HY221_02230 [Candidatus Sungbacteria bacterium]|uniref:Uncharacterized protein n=1 Tax=Candidatus Sungiibacteriota bacterium TaxID=2750080 RepID=A0A932R1X8_9BACT|nr:hypothetical protein [Candidatus Sungbacteria bacterium]